MLYNHLDNECQFHTNGKYYHDNNDVTNSKFTIDI